ncbi:MAG: TlpA disulfide reductase family protein [Candidatus Rokuibacteriota bacterium]
MLALLAYGFTTGPRHLPTPFASLAQAADPFGELALIRASRPTPAADFTVPSLTSQPLRLGDFQGRVVFLNFWATWCPPCKEEMPSMERLYRRYKDRGFTILAISIDAAGADRVAAFVKEHGLTFPVGLDPKLAVANQYAIRGLPASFLIDKAGNIAAVAVGPRDWDGAPARAVVETLLK